MYYPLYRFIRFVLCPILRFFSDFDKHEGYGVPYSETPIVLETLGRNSVAECFTKIKEDLERAIPMLSEVTPSNPGYASQSAAKAMLARVYLYEKDYENAYKYANEVLQMNPIANIDEYEDIWSDKSNKEVIFELTKSAGEEKIGTIFFSDDNSSSFEPSTELIESYTDSDVRLDIFVGDGFDREGVAVKRVNKYKGTTDNVGLADQKLIRSSEMLLIMAEAKAHSNVDDASKLLNQLRENRIEGWETTAYTSRESVLEEILLERRRELCYEGHRFFDMRRFNKPIYKPMIDKTLEVNDHHRVQPIPLAEMQGNPVIANQQNAGY